MVHGLTGRAPGLATIRTVTILLISGSLRAGSTNAAVLATAHDLDPYTVVYPGLASLPHFNPDDDRHPLPRPVYELRTAINVSEAVLFCTPEYAGGLPGSFKNLLDWTVGGMEINDKPCGWINASHRGAAGAHDALRTVLGYTGADVVAAACGHVPVTQADVDPDGVIRVPAVRDRVARVVRAMRQYLS